MSTEKNFLKNLIAYRSKSVCQLKFQRINEQLVDTLQLYNIQIKTIFY